MLTKNCLTGGNEEEKPKEIIIVDPDTEVCEYRCSYGRSNGFQT
jgi:hypothetical protein